MTANARYVPFSQTSWISVTTTVRSRCIRTAFRSIIAKYAEAMNRKAPTRPLKSHPASASRCRRMSSLAKDDATPTMAKATAGSMHNSVSMDDSLSLFSAVGKNLMMALGVPRARICARIVPQAVMIRINPQPSSNPSNAFGKTNIVLMAPKSSPVIRMTVLRADCLATMPMVQS